MNKQQLASKIWESANKMRSKIEANEYKDYIGFVSPSCDWNDFWVKKTPVRILKDVGCMGY